MRAFFPNLRKTTGVPGILSGMNAAVQGSGSSGLACCHHSPGRWVPCHHAEGRGIRTSGFLAWSGRPLTQVSRVLASTCLPCLSTRHPLPVRWSRSTEARALVPAGGRLACMAESPGMKGQIVFLVTPSRIRRSIDSASSPGRISRIASTRRSMPDPKPIPGVCGPPSSSARDG